MIHWALAAVAVLAGPPRQIVAGPGTAYPTLGAALAAADSGDTIRLGRGAYREGPLTIRVPLTLTGEPGTVLYGGPFTLLTVTADSVTLRGLEFRDIPPSAAEDRAALKVAGARGCRLEDLRFTNTFFGLYLSKVTGCVVRRVVARGTGRLESLSGNAIHSWSSSHLVIEDNDLSGHRDGIYFEFTTDSRVAGNLSAGNHRYGIHFMFSDGNTYEGNRFLHNGAGVAVMYSRRVRMTRNRFEDSWGSATYGLLLKDISDSELDHNRFRANSVGVYAEGTTRVTFTGNEFLGNGWGAQVMANAVDTRFLGNRFEGNSFDVATNSVHASSEFRGNFWDRYTGYDLDRDGTGDVPFAPVRLFALVVQQNPPALILLRSFFISLLDAAERVAPALTPQTMVDQAPRLRWAGDEAAQ
ncbi:MAG: nitrous oxide reductase family maturation protein NosD [Gemmatimonadetes bacterium]|nr:nitrous oxide reductase family maturation protein NosD [Gemmatimonadota bacterium]